MKRNQLYPLFLDIKGRTCVVVGGGRVAERKVRGLVLSGAHVRVVSPRVTSRLEQLERKGRVEIRRKEFEEGDLEGAFLVFAATAKREVNEKVKTEAERRNILANVVDDPHLCDFHVPSIVRRRRVAMAISTGGASPLASKVMKRELEKRCAGLFSEYAEIMARFRRYLMSKIEDRRKRQEISRRIEKKSISQVIEMGFQGLVKLLRGDG